MLRDWMRYMHCLHLLGTGCSVYCILYSNLAIQPFKEIWCKACNLDKLSHFWSLSYRHQENGMRLRLEELTSEICSFSLSQMKEIRWKACNLDIMLSHFWSLSYPTSGEWNEVEIEGTHIWDLLILSMSDNLKIGRMGWDWRNSRLGSAHSLLLGWKTTKLPPRRLPPERVKLSYIVNLRDNNL